MLILYDEILRRFPEVHNEYFQMDKDEPYLLMHHVTGWLKSMPTDQITQVIISRLKEFEKWCIEQPRGKDASDDLITIWQVGFLESLFFSDVTRSILPYFLPRDYFITNREYYQQWIGSDNYEKAIKYYE